MKDKRVVYRTPILSPGFIGGGGFEASEADLRKLAEIFSIAANERRLRLMIEMMRRPETRFTDLLRVGINPKLVIDYLEPMVDLGLLIHESKGSTYRPSRKGVLVITTLTQGLTGLLEVAERGKL